MNFRQLEAFVAVVQQRSFSKAAQTLYLTQPTVSAHVSALESELGVQLVSRAARAASPTAAGSVFYEYAAQMLHIRTQALRAMQEYPSLLTSTVRLSASSVPCAYVLPGAMAEFRRSYPEVRFAVREEDSARVVERVLAGEAELGLVGAKNEDERLSAVCIAEDRLVVVTPCGAPYAALPRNDFPAELLASAPFLLRMPGSGTRREADAFLVNRGISPSALNVAATLDSTEGICRAVAAGLGIAILSELAAKGLEESGKGLVFRPDNPFLRRSLYCIHRLDHPLPPVAELFLQHLTERKARR